VSTPLLLKFCGLRTPEDADAAVAAGAQLGGLVFAQASPRKVSLREARQVRDMLFGRAEVVGLFADNAIEEIAAIHSAIGLDRVQLHGSEDETFTEAVENQIGLPVLRAVTISGPEDAERAEKLAGSAFLFDAKPPEDSARRGGHGARFDWDHLAAYKGGRKFLLAGGLTPDNAGEAVGAMGSHPAFAGLDVSSGIERERGIKDAGLMQGFADAARAAC
jgi:phosphoribosylanthranilate isomerase